MNISVSKTEIVPIVLRVGLAFVFGYAAISSLRNPLEWEGFLPSFLTRELAAATLLQALAVYEILLVLWLLSGKFLQYCALLCAVTLLGIVVSSPEQLITTFRDVGLACMAAALYFTQP